MFNIDLKFNDIIIKNIEEVDIEYIQKWFNYQQSLHFNKEKPLELKEFYERFLEYYLSEGEFFLKILKGDIFIGIMKGHVEFKNENEVWIRYFMLDGSYRNQGIGSTILKEFTTYLSENHGIYRFSSCVLKDNESALNFWKSSGFKIARVAKEFYDIEDKKVDMLILKKDIK